MTRYRTGLPATKRLAVELEKRIFSGDLKPGAPLPSMRHFAEERGVDLSSVLGAYRLLEKKGLIVREHGRGCYVGSNIRREIVPNRRLYGFHENMGELLRGRRMNLSVSISAPTKTIRSTLIFSRSG